jgi:hypothetical protein
MLWIIDKKIRITIETKVANKEVEKLVKLKKNFLNK